MGLAWLVGALTGSALLGCRDRAPPIASVRPDVGAPAEPAVDASTLGRRVRPPAIDLVVKQRFSRLASLELPPGFPPPLSELCPDNLDWKIARFELTWGMSQSRRAAGQRAARLAWVSPQPIGQVLTSARSKLLGRGWPARDWPEQARLRHPQHGELHWEIRVPEDRSMQIELRLDPAGTVSGPPDLAPIRDALPPYLGQIPDEAHLRGYEYSRRHAMAPGAGLVERVRLAVLLETPSAKHAERVRQVLEKRVVALGYVADASDGRLHRLSKAAGTTTFTTRTPGPRAGDLVVHHQRRWRHASRARPPLE